MRQVLETVIDKNGGETVQFNPTPRMILFAVNKAKNPLCTETEICRMSHISPDSYTNWMRKYGSYFKEWLEETVDLSSEEDEAKVLHAVGMIQAVQRGNFQYWREMSRTRGVIKDESREAKITINTDFAAILGSGDLESARRAILERARGLENKGGSRVVDVTPGRTESTVPQSKGDGTSQVQERSMVLSNSLGTNGGRAKPRKSVSTVPEQDPFEDPDLLLD